MTALADELAVEDQHFEHSVDGRLASHPFGTHMVVCCVVDMPLAQERSLPYLTAHIAKHRETASIGQRAANMQLAAGVVRRADTDKYGHAGGCNTP